MASVHIARVEAPHGFGGVVALKTIHPHLAHHREFVDMFLDEARIASLIDHPHVCRVHDFGEERGVFYLAMEYLLGETLGDVIDRVHRRQDAYELEELPYYAAAVLAQALDGLHAAHELCDRDGAWLRVVHRDVSPQNLFVGYDGRVKVVDFGLAKAARRVSQTQVGTVKGKLAYLAPESIKGHVPDRRVDVWAAGVCLWEMLTLERLFHRPTDLETVVAVRDQAAPPARSVAWWVPPQLDAIVLRALARDPEERFATARDMARALRAFLIQSGSGMGSREIARWMTDLFEDRRERRLRVLEEVVGEPLFEDEPDSSGPNLVQRVSDGVDWAAQHEVVDPHGEDDEGPDEELVMTRVAPLRVSVEDLAPQRRAAERRWPAVLAFLTLLIVAVGAGAALALQLDAEPEPELSEPLARPAPNG